MRTPRRGWNRRILARYTLLQLPSLLLLIAVLVLLQNWLSLPAWLVWTIVAIWLAKDILLFPLVWRAYDPSPHPSANTLIGQKGVARQDLRPSGYIEIRGELWQAETIGHRSLNRGQSVRVVAMDGLTLQVEPAGPDARENART